jgi:hypothetical protein
MYGNFCKGIYFNYIAVIYTTSHYILLRYTVILKQLLE